MKAVKHEAKGVFFEILCLHILFGIWSHKISLKSNNHIYSDCEKNELFKHSISMGSSKMCEVWICYDRILHIHFWSIQIRLNSITYSQSYLSSFFAKNFHLIMFNSESKNSHLYQVVNSNRSLIDLLLPLTHTVAAIRICLQCFSFFRKNLHFIMVQ